MRGVPALADLHRGARQGTYLNTGAREGYLHRSLGIPMPAAWSKPDRGRFNVDVDLLAVDQRSGACSLRGACQAAHVWTFRRWPGSFARGERRAESLRVTQEIGPAAGVDSTSRSCR